MSAPRQQSWLSRKMVGEKMRAFWTGPEGEARRRLWSERTKSRWSQPDADDLRRKYAEIGRKNAELRWGRNG